MSNFVACDSIDVVGTSYQGVVKTTFDELVNKFGDPTYTDASPYEKVNAQWSLQFDVPTEDGEDYEWHIGGFDFDSVDLVQGVLDS